MTVPAKLKVGGAATLNPVVSSGSFPSGHSVGRLDVDRTVTAHSGNRAFAVNSPSPGFLDLLAGSGVTNATFVFLRVRTGTFVVDVTTSAGANQQFDLSGEWLVNNPTPGSEITGLRIQGVGDIEIMIAGD